MSDEDQDTVWPLPKFTFSVQIGDGRPVAFQEVSGLEVEAQPVEHRSGNAKVFSRIKMPGLVKTGNVMLKKGVSTGDTRLSDWVRQVQMNIIERRTVTISLLDETGTPTMVWRLKNAFPVKMTGLDWKAEGDEVAIETLELAHEGVTIENG